MRKDVTGSGQERKILEITSRWIVPTGITAVVKLRRDLFNRFHSTININQFGLAVQNDPHKHQWGTALFWFSKIMLHCCNNDKVLHKLFSDNSMSLFLSSSLAFQAILLLLGFNCIIPIFCMFFGLCWNQHCRHLWHTDLWYHRVSTFFSHAYFSSLIEDKSTFVLVPYSMSL